MGGAAVNLSSEIFNGSFVSLIFEKGATRIPACPSFVQCN